MSGGIVALALASPPGAGAAVTVGATPVGATGCGGGGGPQTVLQSQSPADLYSVPSGGVITSWSYRGGAVVSPQVKLKVGRAAGGSNYAIVGESASEIPLANALTTYPTRIPVRAGDLLGNMTSTGQGCGVMGVTGHFWLGASADVAPGPATLFIPSASTLQVNASAELEADADLDGFGDQTQDRCPTNPALQGECTPAGVDRVAPNTAIIKGPADRSRKKKVTYKFISSEAGSTFQCKIDSKGYAPCTSPAVLAVKRGKHTFSVWSQDAAGNSDVTPATDKFKVVRKKKPANPGKKR